MALSRRRPEAWRDDARRIWVEADLLDEATIEAAADRARAEAPELVIAATGLLHGPGLAPEKTYRSLNRESLTDVFAVNAVGPALLAKHFLPLAPPRSKSVFAAISARVGSIGDNRLGGWHSYRASKAALNMLIRTLAIEHKRSRPFGACVALHPGTVDTPLSRPFQSNVPQGGLFSASHAAGQLLEVISGLEPEQTGRFFAWDGSEIPW